MIHNTYDLVTVTMEKTYADRVAIRYVDEATVSVVEKTFAEYGQDIRRSAEYLRAALQQPKGKRVVLLSRNCYAYTVHPFGIILSGGVLVVLNQKKTWAELEYELGLVEPSLILTDGIDYGYRAELEAAYGSILRPIDEYLAWAPGELTPREDPDALMMLMFTSGTTGRSKGVMLSERNIFGAMGTYVPMSDYMNSHLDTLAPAEYSAGPCSHYTFLPLFHMATFICLYAYPLSGMAQNICCDARNFYRDLKLMHSDIMAAAPVIVEMVYNDIKRGHRDRWNGMWALCCSSASLNPEIMLALVKEGFFISQCYGMTEACGDGIVNVQQDAKHIAALGKPDDHLEYKLDETGEICIRGDSVMMGYLNDPEGTAEVIDAEGWLHTGDLARKDEDGYYYMVGRKKNLIILDNGENVSPEELEHLLAECPAIQECLVKEQEKKICAVVYCAAGNEQTVRDFITETNRTLPLYKRISAVEFSADPLPRNAVGKLLRR